MRRLTFPGVIFVFALLIVTDLLAQPEDNEVALERIVVTAVRYPQEIQNVPASVSVISEHDIENSNAQTIPDILRSEPGVVVRDYYGNGTKASVDLRGFGETAASNTLVLVDGRRINQIDLSGVDWTQIPLDSVGRIEIVRGASSVLYGDNAVGGVINIITKKGEAKPAFEFESIGGSYDMNKQRLCLSGKEDKLSYFLNLSRHFTHGYRRNSYHRTSDFSSKLIYNLLDNLSLNLSGGYHEADYGVAGALRESQLSSSSRRDSKFMDDDAGEEDYYILLDTNLNFSDNTRFNLPLSFRRRYMQTSWGTGGYGINLSRIDTIGICPKLILNSNMLNKPNTTVLGLDFYKIDSIMNDLSSSGAQTGDSDVDKRSIGTYLQNELLILDKLALNLGYRYERARYDFYYNDLTDTYADVDDLSRFDEEVFKAGLVFNFKQQSKIFFNLGRGFRFPITEEFLRYNFLTFPFGRYINKELMPQKCINYEIGLTHRLKPKYEVNLTAFLMRAENEIYLNPLTYTNENYDRTEHRGIELGWNWGILDNLDIFGNYNFTEALFDGGIYNGNQIPAVPRHKAFIGMNCKINKQWEINSSLNYVGKRYFISDQSHSYPQMNDFLTLDIKISYKFTDSTIFLGMNNIFDKEYSEYGAISMVYSERGYYPSPGRNFIFGYLLEF